MAEADLRLFIAVALPAATIQSCQAVIADARAHSPERGIRWVRTENLHITLRFLGETPPAIVEPVADALRAAVTSLAPFEVRLAGAGAFPADRRPRTLWIGIERGADELGAMAGMLQRSLASLGWPVEDRPFRPHLTIARTDAASGGDGTRAADAMVAAASGWQAGFTAVAATLFRSHLGAGPPRYEPIVEAPLLG